MNNLYVHFPFCRRKCTYCALYSRAGTDEATRSDYVKTIAAQLRELKTRATNGFSTVYFGGGTPALCNLVPVFEELELADDYEFTVELHPLDVCDELLATLKAGGVNRISVGVEALDDATLAHMRRGYTLDETRRALEKTLGYFENVGIDLIVGYPNGKWRIEDGKWEGVKHCSVYALQNERGLKDVPDDNEVMDEIRLASEALSKAGLKRYEISNYAVPGYECRHNLAVWRGEDYFGIGEGACGREGKVRTRGVRGTGAGYQVEYRREEVSEEFDAKERRLFRLRTREGIDVSGFPVWREQLTRMCGEGLVEQTGADGYRLTARGMEVCDSILLELV